MLKYFFIALSVLFFQVKTHSQTVGCTDPQATNFNVLATFNNGSCIYDNAFYKPILIGKLTATLSEISGIIYYNGKLFGINDGGNLNAIYSIDTTNGTILKSIVLEGVSNVDWEDITQDSGSVYVGDFGNNYSGNRSNLVIYKFPKSFLDVDTVTIVPAHAIEKIYFKYSDQNSLEPTGINNTKFDCEAMVISRGKLHLFTKNWVNDMAVHYSLPLEPGTYSAERLDSLNTGGYLITGATAGGYDELLFTAYNKAGSCSFFLVFGFDSTSNFFATGNKRRITLPLATTVGQLESVALVNPFYGFTASEAFTELGITFKPKIHRLVIDNFILDYYKHNQMVYAVPGMMRFNTTTDKYEIYNGYNWKDLH